MTKHKQDIEQTLAQLHIEGEQGRIIAEEVSAGDDLLERCGQGEIPPGALEQVEQAVRKQLLQDRASNRWGRRIMQAAAVMLVAAGLGAWMAYENLRQEQMTTPAISVAVQESDPFESEINMWELSLQEGDDTAEQIDELPLAELALWLDELETETMEDTIGKEHDHEAWA